MIGLTLEKLDDFEAEELARGIFLIPDDSEIDEVRENTMQTPPVAWSLGL